jgi:hypothetical protein
MSGRKALFASGHLKLCCQALQKTDVECVKLLVPCGSLAGNALKNSIAQKVALLSGKLSQNIAHSAYNQSRLGILGTCGALLASHADAIKELALDPLWSGEVKDVVRKPPRSKRRVAPLAREPDGEVRSRTADALPLVFKAFEITDPAPGNAQPLPSDDLRLAQGVFHLPEAHGIFDTRA